MCGIPRVGLLILSMEFLCVLSLYSSHFSAAVWVVCRSEGQSEIMQLALPERLLPPETQVVLLSTFFYPFPLVPCHHLLLSFLFFFLLLFLPLLLLLPSPTSSPSSSSFSYFSFLLLLLPTHSSEGISPR